MQRWKKCIDNEGNFVDNVNFLKDVPMIYVNFIKSAIILLGKKGGITFIPPPIS